jgi:glycosyltransferase involved in cell wall biosynthesis
MSYVYDLLKDYYDIKFINYSLFYPKLLFPGTTQNDLSKNVIKQVPNERLINSINPVSWKKTADIINKEKADLVIFDWWNPFFGPSHFAISRLIKKQYKGKIVFITENVISHEGRMVDRSLTKLGLKNADYFIALSDAVEQTLKDFYPGKKVYRSALPIYDCYDMGESLNPQQVKKSLGFNDDDMVLLFFGYVRRYKGLNVLIEAMPDIIRDNPKIKLLIVGEFYDSAEKYYDQIKSLGLEGSVKVVQRFVPNEEVGQYYTIADIVILPYLSATQSGILNIAYGFKKPVLVTEVGGLADDVIEGKTGFTVPPGNPTSIAQGVKKFLSVKDNTDFTSNIELKLKDQLFYNFPGIIENIISQAK